MTGMSETVHVAWGTSRADAVRKALLMQGCGERVIALTHDLSVGPIGSLDADARRRWFAANTRSDDDPDEGTADPEASWTEATGPGVHPVYWVCLTDAGEHACFLEFVTRMAGRPFDIVDVTGFDAFGVSRTAPVWSLGQLRPEEMVDANLLGRRRPFTRAESDAAMVDWKRLRLEDAPIRIVRDGRLVSAALTHYDEVLIEQASVEREPLIELVARVLDHLEGGSVRSERGCSYEILFVRILTIGETGALEVTGRGPGMRDYCVRNPLA